MVIGIKFLNPMAMGLLRLPFLHQLLEKNIFNIFHFTY